jgi:hypothetical protein
MAIDDSLSEAQWLLAQASQARGDVPNARRNLAAIMARDPDGQIAAAAQHALRQINPTNVDESATAWSEVTP